MECDFEAAINVDILDVASRHFPFTSMPGCEKSIFTTAEKIFAAEWLEASGLSYGKTVVDL